MSKKIKINVGFKDKDGQKHDNSDLPSLAHASQSVDDDLNAIVVGRLSELPTAAANRTRSTVTECEQ